MQEVIKAIQSKNSDSINLETLENVIEQYPYFQSAKSILLKKYYQAEHYKYNNFLKNTAAHTVQRDVLFNNVITLESLTQKTTPKPETESEPITNESPLLIVEATETHKPFEFSDSEKHSFQQWLQLTHTEPIQRESAKNEDKPIQPKLGIINQFIQNNPKISPIKKVIPVTNPLAKRDSSNISNELMTETLAKVYLAQKKYDNAIQAYKILSLKYPEKSSLFADQIQRIKILQTHK